MCYKKANQLYNMESLGPLTRHHRRPRSQGGRHEGDNISFVPNKLHEAYHLLFANNSVKRISEILNEHWIDPETALVPIPRDLLQTIYKIISTPRK